MPRKTAIPQRLQGAPLPRRVQLLGALSLRYQTMLYAVGLFLVFGVLSVVLSAILINGLKNQLVEAARDEVRSAGEQASREIERALEEQQTNQLAAVANNPAVRAQMRIMSREGGVILAAMIDSNGNCIYQQFGEDESLEDCPVRTGSVLGGTLPTSDDLTWELQMRQLPEGVSPERVPIRLQGQTIGYLEYGISDVAALGRLDPISRHITSGLATMALLVAAFLGLSAFLLYRLSQRHVELQRRHDEAQHLANIGHMASGLAHEIRNPLHAMNLHLDAALDEIEDPRETSPAQVSRVVRNVQTQIANLNSILTNFMSYALPGRIETEPIRLEALVGEIVTSLSPEVEARSIAVRRSVPAEAWIEADPTAVRQVLTNVVLNAVQLMDGETRELTFGASRGSGGAWELTIDDTGPGLPPGAEEDIFGAFVSHRPGGTGFGLAIARRIMEAHGGSIRARTRPEGGARFTLAFPAGESPEGYAPRAHGGDRRTTEEPATIG